jgi:hypothetical protein
VDGNELGVLPAQGSRLRLKESAWMMRIGLEKQGSGAGPGRHRRRAANEVSLRHDRCYMTPLPTQPGQETLNLCPV